MAEKTGFDKFVEKQAGTPVQIRPKANVIRETNNTGSEEKASKRTAGGRPRKDNSQPKLVPIIFQVDENLKEILESLKYRSHKTTLKGVLMEAIDLLLEKYGIEK